MSLMLTSPVAIGAIGGSGTRMVTNLLIELGFHMGPDLPHSRDDFRFTDLFVHREILGVPDEEFRRRLESYLAQVQADLSSRPEGFDRASQHWGWKEPNAHVVLLRLMRLMPHIRYIHLMRNGLDMAFSENQLQPERWGHLFLGRAIEATPRDRLKYWVAVHRRVLRVGAALGSRFHVINYDRLCRSPDEPLARLVEFVGGTDVGSVMSRLRAQIKPPDSIGRFRQHGLDAFDADDVEFVRSLGFDT
jgi:hypothetical protein